MSPNELLESQVQSHLAMYDDDDDDLIMEVTLSELLSMTKKTDGKEVATVNPLADGTSKEKGKCVATDVPFPFLKWCSTKDRADNFESDHDNSQLSYMESEYGEDKNDDTDVDETVEWTGSKSKRTEDEGTNQAFNFEVCDFDVEEEERNENMLHSASDSDDEIVKKRFLEFNSSTDMEMVQFKLGMIFTNCKEFRQTITQYCIQNGKEVYYHRNEKYKLSVKCKREGCPVALCWKT